jgi:ABC-2 type transport system permease protein
MRLDVRPQLVWVVIKREYLSRVKTKGFWLGTLLLPIFMAAMAFLPSLFLLKTAGALRLAIVDESGKIGTPFAERIRSAPADPAETKADLAKTPALAEEAPRRARALASKVTVTLETPAADAKAQNAELDRRVLAEEIDAWMRIPADVLTSNRAEYHGESVSNFVTQELLENRLSAVTRQVRLSEAGLDAAQIERLSEDVDIQTTRVTAEGGREESGMAGFFVAYFLFFLLFLTIMIWGQQVLTGVLEEKSSRIVEVIVAAVRPFEFLMGKLLGIAAVGMTQLSIWLGFMVLITAPAVVAALPMLASSGAKIPSIAPGLLIHFLAFFLLGFLLYASYFAAIGSAFNNLQEAQQTAGFLNFILVAPFICFMAIINDPDSALSVGLSFFPLFTPLLMMLRIAVKMPPVWQVAAGYLISILAVVGMVWLCGKIYRVGILMYGKKPTLPEIWKWLRYA